MIIVHFLQEFPCKYSKICMHILNKMVMRCKLGVWYKRELSKNIWLGFIVIIAGVYYWVIVITLHLNISLWELYDLNCDQTKDTRSI